MWFRNLQLFRLESELPSAEKLSDKLASLPFTGCGRLDRQHHGFVPPFGGEALARAAGDALWVSLQIEEKLLPATVVNELLDERISDIEAKEARRVGRKEKQTLKDQITDELLPQAFTRRRRVTAMLDPQSGWMAVDAGNLAMAEALISALLQCHPDIKLKRPDAEQSPAARMADLLLTPDQDTQLFQVDADCELKGPGTPQSVARFSKHNLLLPEVAAHLAAGMRPAKLGLIWQDRLSMLMLEDWQIKRLKFLDLIQDQVTESDAEDQQALVEATLTIMSAELRAMLADLILWLGEPAKPNADKAAADNAPQAAVSSADVPW